jgi:tRNA pseudouridine55 synthase
MLSGILYVDKPRGMTSHDVVATIRRLTDLRAVGHTGTLDPEASGLLILCLGRATKLARLFEDLDKTYWTVLCLGICTDTQDATGIAVRQRAVPALSGSDVQSVLAQFTGPVKQIPPMYSAVKYHGQRLYRLARQGKTVVRPARDIYIRRLKLLDLHGPWMTLSVTCSKGTYIRTLCEDIGLALGYGAHMVHLQRCRVGAIDLHSAWSLECLRQHSRDGTWESLLVPVDQALEFLPALRLSPQQYEDFQVRQSGALAAILNPTSQVGCLAPCYRLCTPGYSTVAIIQRQASSPERWKLYNLTPHVPGS